MPAIDEACQTTQPGAMAHRKYHSCSRVPRSAASPKRGMNSTKPMSVVKYPRPRRRGQDRWRKYGCRAAPKMMKRRLTTLPAMKISHRGEPQAISGSDGSWADPAYSSKIGRAHV